jgi:hypothetical protein
MTSSARSVGCGTRYVTPPLVILLEFDMGWSYFSSLTRAKKTYP